MSIKLFIGAAQAFGSRRPSHGPQGPPKPCTTASNGAVCADATIATEAMERESRADLSAAPSQRDGRMEGQPQEMKRANVQLMLVLLCVYAHTSATSGIIGR